MTCTFQSARKYGLQTSNLLQLRVVHTEGLSNSQGHRRARPLGTVRGPSMTVPVTAPKAVRISPQEIGAADDAVLVLLFRSLAGVQHLGPWWSGSASKIWSDSTCARENTHVHATFIKDLPSSSRRAHDDDGSSDDAQTRDQRRHLTSHEVERENRARALGERRCAGKIIV